MTILRDDTFARRGRTAPRQRYVSALVFALIFLSIALLVLSRLNHPYVEAMRSAVTPFVASVLSTLAVPLAPLRDLSGRLDQIVVSQDELKRLQAENQALKSWEFRARDLERQVAALSDLARVAKQPEIPFVTARVVADATGPFARSVVINTGSARGVKAGHPVINADGLVGRVVDVSANAARVLLISDINLRVPVSVGDAAERGIAVGDNGAVLRVKHLRRESKVKAGDVAATSGRGGLFPRALRIGLIEMAGETATLRPFANLNQLDFVSVLLFESPVLSLAADQQVRAGRQRQ
ncbi:MAG: rod shape-determining protein MreC [Pseudomonadota bacterium]